MIDAGLKEIVGPEGETVPVKLSVPEKPFALVSVMVVVAVEP